MSLTPESNANPSNESQSALSNEAVGGRWPLRQGASVAGRGRPPKLYRIGEIVDYCGVSRQTIHNYTTMGLLQESDRTRGGHRLYDESVFDRIDAIARMKEENRSLGFIRDYFAQPENEEHETEPLQQV